METFNAIAASWGYGALFLLGIMEFGGVPIGAVPLLLVAGSIASTGMLDFAGAVGSVAAGGLLADVFWLSLARWKGQRIVDAACGLSANPASCVLSVRSRIAHFGPLFIVGAKFVPGVADLAAAAAGSGPLRGQRLEPVAEAYVAFWFAWAAFHRQTTLWTNGGES